VRLPFVRVRPTLAAAVLLAVAVLAAMLPAPAARAAPGAAGPEGGTKALRDQLDAAARGFNDAAARLETSKARQIQLANQMQVSEAEVTRLTAQVSTIAATAYKAGRISGIAALLDSSSPSGMFERAVTLDAQARLSDGELRRVKQAKTTLANQQAALNTEIKVQQDQLAEMDKRKKAAEKALGSASGATASGVTGTGGARAAAAVARRPDGSLAPESCSQDDPTTSGCITPRTLHALNQAKAAGFTRFVSCYRAQEDGGEHPRGRACDFSAQTGGFGGVATGGDRDYGNRLAAWFIANARNLGVLYVIWFKQIWMPSTGWRAYNNGNGDPSSDHTNHVHLSVQ
jgi:hypothetical protein